MGSNSMRAAALMAGPTSVSWPSAPGPGADTPGVGLCGGDMFVITIAPETAEVVPAGSGP